MKTYETTQELCRFLLKMPKNQSFFLYFLLESHDNLCFYSTLPHQEGDMYRMMEIFSTVEFLDDLNRLWSYLEDELQLQIVESEVVSDFSA